MSEVPTPPPDEVAAVNAARIRRQRRIAGIGAAVALALALLAGGLGGSGQVGAAIFLLVTAVSCAGAATYGVFTALRDDLRRVRVSRARIGWTAGLFVLTALLMAMVAGVGG